MNFVAREAKEAIGEKLGSNGPVTIAPPEPKQGPVSGRSVVYNHSNTSRWKSLRIVLIRNLGMEGESVRVGILGNARNICRPILPPGSSHYYESVGWLISVTSSSPDANKARLPRDHAAASGKPSM